MKRQTLSVVVALAFAVVAQAQTEEQKIQFERAVKLIRSPQPNWRDGLNYLLARRSGLPVVEQVTAEYRATKQDRRFHECLWSYLGKVATEDFSSGMVDETIGYFQRLVKANDGTYADFIDILGEIGPHARLALPSLEWVRDNDPIERNVNKAIAAIRKIKAK